MQHKISFVAAATIVIGLAGAAWSFPTSLNCIPTAETVGGNCLLLEIGNYGYSDVMTAESTNGVMSQFGIGDRLEFGIDNYKDEESSQAYLNGKFKMLEESDRAPAFAVGMMDIANTGKPTLYSVASKTMGIARTHIGFLRGSYAHGIMAGVDLDIGNKLWFGVDYLPGESNHLRVGISRCVGSDTWLQFSAGMPNNRAQASTEIGITLSAYINLAKS